MTLGEFRTMTAALPEKTEILIYLDEEQVTRDVDIERVHWNPYSNTFTLYAE